MAKKMRRTRPRKEKEQAFVPPSQRTGIFVRDVTTRFTRFGSGNRVDPEVLKQFTADAVDVLWGALHLEDEIGNEYWLAPPERRDESLGRLFRTFEKVLHRCRVRLYRGLKRALPDLNRRYHGMRVVASWHDSRGILRVRLEDGTEALAGLLK